MDITKEYRMSFTQKAKSIIEKMTLEEKVYLMSGNATLLDVFQEKVKQEHYNEHPYVAGGNERLQVPAIRFCDGPRGVASGTGKSTCFPVSMNRGASFDLELEEEIGKAVAREVRGYGANFYGVCVLTFLIILVGEEARKLMGKKVLHWVNLGRQWFVGFSQRE